MENKTIYNKFPKYKKYGIILIIIFFNILSILIIVKFTNSSGTPTGEVFGFGILGLFQILAWGLPLMVYLLDPFKIRIFNSRIAIKNRLRIEKNYSKESIFDLKYKEDPLTKEPIYVAYTNPEKSDEGFSLGYTSGKAVWDWYFNEGEWKLEENR